MLTFDNFALFVVSTHSRLKAADIRFKTYSRVFMVSTHSRLKAAESIERYREYIGLVSTHSRLKAADFNPCLSRC